MNLELTDAEAAALTRLLSDITCNYLYPLSSRIQTPCAILAKLKLELGPPAASTEPRVYAPSRGRYRASQGL